MRSWLYAALGLIVLNAGAVAASSASASALWADLSAKRDKLPGLHQEFTITHTFKTAHATQGSRQKVVLDISQAKWREQSVSGSGTDIRIFDGQELFLMEADGNEFVRVRPRSRDYDATPAPYDVAVDWAKASEQGRQPCGFAGNDHVCVTIRGPLKPWVRSWNNRVHRMTNGIAQIVIDSETGLVVRCETQEAVDDGRTQYIQIRTYSLSRMNYGVGLDAALFKLPENGLHEVKELTPWSLARVKKELIGKPAPPLDVKDLQGKPVSLADLKGKTVLLDFWTTWCPPCIADAPALDKLYSKYGSSNFAIIGISVSEERETVQGFLKKHPHNFPVVLTTENELPRPYQVGAFPTYMVIASDGTLTNVADGDQGFGELRKFLKKAGMDTE